MAAADALEGGGQRTVETMTLKVVSALKKESGAVYNFREGVTEGLSEEVTFEQRPEGGRGAMCRQRDSPCKLRSLSEELRTVRRPM